MNVADVMTPEPYTVEADEELDVAMELMDRRDLRHLPVVRGDELVGIVSDRDLLEATGWEPAHLGTRDGPARPVRRLDEVMRHPVASVSPEDTVVTASVELLLKRIGCLPVVSNGALVGILTERDLLTAWLGVAGQGPDSDPAVEQLMTRDLLTLSPRARLEEAISLCRNSEVRHLPVVEAERLVGIVSDRDLKRALGRGQPGETPVDELMTRDVATVDASSPLRAAAELMYTRSIGGIPVLSGEQLVGILTLTDLLTHCTETLREPDLT